MRALHHFLNAMRKCIALSLCIACGTGLTWGQDQSIAPQRSKANVFVRPYLAPTVPPSRMGNSTRLHALVRAGKLYLTVQDAIALAIENNIDIEVNRYNPLIDAWNLERAEAGGPLPGVPSGVSQAGSVATGQGVAGSQAAAGVSTGGGNAGSSNSVNATISQIGPVTPTLDPVFQSVTSFSHKSAPQSNSVQSGVLNLEQNTRNYSEEISKGLITGGTVSFTFRNSYLNENAPSDVLNPSNGTSVQVSLQHNLLQGFGIAVNSRNITIARANLNIEDLTFKNQLIGSVVNVLDLYYGLVADYQDVKAKQAAVDVAQRFYNDNQKQVQIGTMAPLDVTTAEAQVASSQQDLVIAQTTLEQQQIQLKDVLSRNGLADPVIREAQIIPLDHIEVPEQDNLPPLKELVATAMANRPDIAAEKLNVINSQTNALGTANAVLPQLAALLSATTQGLAGTPRFVPLRGGEGRGLGTGPLPSGFIPCPPSLHQPPGTVCEVPDPYFVGGLGNALGQTFRRNFPTERAGAFIAPTLRNRVAQADNAIDQLGLRQSELQTQRDVNQVAVDVSTGVVGVQQARVRYQAAVRNRILEQQLLDAEQKKFSLGASTTFNVVQQQRDLATSQSAETAALVTYSNARVALDQTLGTTLQVNHISLGEVMKGQVARTSALPATLPQQP
ncbi:MAG TPA: TolC family protein [Bryobacteraceae bacterium]|nr:TolC family protein [Bryobacteraceae bacterium]